MRVTVYNQRYKKVAICQVENWQQNCRVHSPGQGWKVYTPEVPIADLTGFEGIGIIPDANNVSLKDYDKATESSFMDEFSADEKDELAIEVGGQLLDDWIDAHIDDVYDMDLEIVEMSDYNNLRDKLKAHHREEGVDTSFMESLDEISRKRITDELSMQLFDDWYNNNLDEGNFYADEKVASMSGNAKVKDAFNKRYDLSPDDPDYV
jgi:hypothetical protein